MIDMNYIKNIINYFVHHSPSREITERVHRRLLDPDGETERDEALSKYWDSLAHEECATEETAQAYNRFKRTIHPRKINFSWKWVGMAALWVAPIVMCGLLAHLYLRSSLLDSKAEPSAISYVQYFAKPGTTQQCTLPDGSRIWLNEGSTLIYPSTFSEGVRGVFLSGEGYFEVTKDKNHPFVVSTGHLQVEVLGTTFNVSAYPEDEQTKVTLETGKVKVNVKNDSTNYYLTPDYQLIHTPATGKTEQIRVHARNYSEWRSGIIYFDDTSFEEVLNVLERIYHVRIYLQVSSYKDEKIHVQFRKNEPLENVLRIIRMVAPNMEYQIIGNDVYIR